MHVVDPFNDKIPSSSRIDRVRRNNLSAALDRTWDRVNVLGDDEGYGHTGCVNALSWARDGELLLSGGDDRTVQVWQMDPAQNDQDYPFTRRAVFHTGHRANIFNVHNLPHSNRIVTAAGDRQIRVFDLGELPGITQEETVQHPRTQAIRCHKDRVKRITTEDSPNLFLSVAEDGCVRQHDLRTPHSCYPGSSECPPALIEMDNVELSTLALSPLTPYQFVVAGESPFGYLFDRRNIGRDQQKEYGMIPNGLTMCVRRFGRHPKRPVAEGPRPIRRRAHITGARVSDENGHEVLLSYSADAVYLFSTLDDPADENAKPKSSAIVPNNQTAEAAPPGSLAEAVLALEKNPWSEVTRTSPTQERMAVDHENVGDEEDHESDQEEEEEAEDSEDLLNEGVDEAAGPLATAIVRPRRRYAGARNIDTIKDVNFLGPNDEYVTSGSDDGNFFVWSKTTGALKGVYEGDSSVVNVIEGHPHLPLVAVSGIDTTVKLFAPVHGPSSFSKMSNAERIMKLNAKRDRPSNLRGINFATLLEVMASAHSMDTPGEGGAGRPECTSQ